MTATQAYLLKALLSEIGHIEVKAERLNMIDTVRDELDLLEKKTLKQRIKKENIK